MSERATNPNQPIDLGAIPPPGSASALAAGCFCSEIDNHYGEGRPGGTFVIQLLCPLHGEFAHGEG
jgi:hypothetical protein